jgi:hypothetical protein
MAVCRERKIPKRSRSGKERNMTRNSVLVLGVCALLLLVAGMAPAEPPKPPSGHFSLDLVFAKGDKPDTYICTAKFVDLQSGQVLASPPRVIARVGEPAILRSGVVAGSNSYDLVLTFLVSPGHVQYEFKASQNGQVTNSQKAVITL